MPEIRPIEEKESRTDNLSKTKMDRLEHSDNHNDCVIEVEAKSQKGKFMQKIIQLEILFKSF